jgi:hypothetical protein
VAKSDARRDVRATKMNEDLSREEEEGERVKLRRRDV